MFNPSATKPGLSNRLWEIEQPAAAAANQYFIAANNRIGQEVGEFGADAPHFYGSSYFVDPRGNYVGEVASQDKEEIVVRDLDFDEIIRTRNDWQFYRDRRPESYTKTTRRKRIRMAKILIKGGTVVSAHRLGAAGRPRRRRDDRRAARARLDLLGIDSTTPTPSSTRPASTSSPAASTGTRTWRCRSAARRRRDTFETGTRAAAWGGTTTIVDFVVQAHGQRVQDQVALWHEKAGGNCAIDYAFHQIIGDVNDESLKAMDELIGEGITSFKLFMAYPGVFLSSDGQILQAMQTAAGNGGLIMMHAENGSAIDVLVQQALARGETAPYFHGITRPWQAEQEATHRAIMLADLTGAPLYVVHVSAKQALARIAEARNAGQNVFGETCPQYLYLSLEEHLGARGLRGREVGVLDAAARRAPRGTRTSCGSTSAPATSRPCPPTTARSA